MSREAYEAFLEEIKEINRRAIAEGFYWDGEKYISKFDSSHGYRWADRLNFGFKCWERKGK